MEVSKTSKPEIVQLFENFLWVNSPKDWILKSTYFQEKLFVSMLISVSKDVPYKKIRRDYSTTTIIERKEDLYGLASDCIDEMKQELNNNGD